MNRAEPAVDLRPSEGRDAPFLRALYASTRQAELAQVPWDEDQKEVFLAAQFEARAQSYRASFPRADERIVVADGRPAGAQVVDRPGHEVRLVDLALMPRWRGRGVGTRLVERLVAEADGAGLPVRLHVVQADARVAAWYRRLGFRLVEDRGVYGHLERLPGAPQAKTAS